MGFSILKPFGLFYLVWSNYLMSRERTFRLPVFSACHTQGRASVPWVGLGQKKGTSPLSSIHLGLNLSIRHQGTGGETLKSCSFWEEGPLTWSWGERESCVLDLQQSGVECPPYWAGRREGRNSLNSSTADFHLFYWIFIDFTEFIKKKFFFVCTHDYSQSLWMIVFEK